MSTSEDEAYETRFPTMRESCGQQQSMEWDGPMFSPEQPPLSLEEELQGAQYQDDRYPMAGGWSNTSRNTVINVPIQPYSPASNNRNLTNYSTPPSSSNRSSLEQELADIATGMRGDVHLDVPSEAEMANPDEPRTHLEDHQQANGTPGEGNRGSTELRINLEPAHQTGSEAINNLNGSPAHQHTGRDETLQANLNVVDQNAGRNTPSIPVFPQGQIATNTENRTTIDIENPTPPIESLINLDDAEEIRAEHEPPSLGEEIRTRREQGPPVDRDGFFNPKNTTQGTQPTHQPTINNPSVMNRRTRTDWASPTRPYQSEPEIAFHREEVLHPIFAESYMVNQINPGQAVGPREWASTRVQQPFEGLHQSRTPPNVTRDFPQALNDPRYRTNTTHRTPGNSQQRRPIPEAMPFSAHTFTTPNPTIRPNPVHYQHPYNLSNPPIFPTLASDPEKDPYTAANTCYTNHTAPNTGQGGHNDPTTLNLSSRNKNLLARIVKKPEVLTEPEGWAAFRDCFKSYIELQDVPRHLWTGVLLTFLSPSLQQRCHALRLTDEQLADPDTALSLIDQAMVSQVNKLGARMQLTTMVQADRSLTEFVNEIRQKARICKFGEGEAGRKAQDSAMLSTLVSGIKDKDCTMELLKADVNTFEQGVKIAHSIETAKLARSNTGTSLREDILYAVQTQQHQAQQSTAELINEQRTQIEELKTQLNNLQSQNSTRRDPKDQRCYSCNAPGHYARDCRWGKTESRLNRRVANNRMGNRNWSESANNNGNTQSFR